MPSRACEEAISSAQRIGSALLKVISPNDVGMTGAHQCGYYLPKEAWKLFSVQRPERGINYDHQVVAVWQDGRVTQSVVKWYGRGTRFEYRMTRFGRGFPYLGDDFVGSFLVLVPERLDRFLMYVLDLEDDMEDLQAALGVEVVRGWAIYSRDAVLPLETENECIERRFRSFTSTLAAFPATAEFAREAHNSLVSCISDFVSLPSDDQLVRCVAAEYALFQMVERRLCEPEIVRLFKSVEDFLSTAQTILQRRKSRAGRSLEHHVERLLRDAAVPFVARADVEGTKPDILIPGKAEYLDPAFPEVKLFAIGVKTTCKDRWRQVLREAPRIRHKHILTLQKGISPNQLDEMKSSDVTLVVPGNIHREYPASRRGELLTIAAFVDQVRTILAGN